MKISGIGFIYMITSPSNRIYVGSTNDIDDRWRHYDQLTCKNQIKLYNSFMKYGVKNHIFEIIWAGDINDMLKYETLIGWGFNVLEKDVGLNLKLPKLGEIYSVMSEETKNKIRESNKGWKHSEKTKKKLSDIQIGKKLSKDIKDKMSNSHKGKKFSDSHKINSGIAHKKPIIQYTMDGEFIKEWDSAKDASKYFNISNKSICACCRGKTKTSMGFKWKYKNE